MPFKRCSGHAQIGDITVYGRKSVLKKLLHIPYNVPNALLDPSDSITPCYPQLLKSRMRCRLFYTCEMRIFAVFVGRTSYVRSTSGHV